MIKLVAFDWNGTLLADTFTVEYADNVILAKFGLPKITKKRFQETFDIPISKYWEALGFSSSLYQRHHQEIAAMFTKLYEPLAERCRTRAGAKAALYWLTKNKIKTVIYSNHTVSGIRRQLKRLKISNFLEEVLARLDGDNSHMHQRGKAEKLHNYLRQRGIKPKEVVSVGDTEEEIQIGQHHGYHTVALTGGYNTMTRLKRQRPDFLIHNLTELKNIIRQLNFK